ncbi:Chs5p-Arf1p-binding protein [Gracilaria domingensis]|nr:Chs5p-Arf1p-binding protein [Gracilaria domingensis]
MPSASRAEPLVGIQEVSDKPHPDISAESLSDALAARAHLVHKFPPMGPPDMVYLRKRYVPVVGADKIYGYYHFVRGAQPSSVASISAYIVDIVRNNGLDPLPWVSAGGWEIVSATFVAFNIVSKLDIKVHVDFPGSTTASAVDGAGNNVELNDSIWQELLVSSVVRDMSSSGEKPLYPCLRVISPPSLGVDAAFIDAAKESCARWHLSGRDDSEQETSSPAKSRIAVTIRDHFIQSALYETAIEFFNDESLCEVDKDFAVYAATAARLRGDLEKADEIVDQVLGQSQESHLAWMERANILRTKGDISKALEAAKAAATTAKDDLDACILLADIYVDIKEHTKSFEFLNDADVPTPPLDPFLRHLIPNRRNLTKPSDGALRAPDAVRVLADRLREEKQLSTEKTDESLYELPAKLMTSTEKRCYNVLVKILNDLSWDEMLAVRGQCFVMEKDIEDGNLSMSDEEESLEDAPANEDEADDVTQGITTISLNDDTEDDEGQEGTGSMDSVEARKKTLEKTGKKVCKPWLDYLVTNMYHDLKAMAMWNAEEQQHSTESSFPTSSATSDVDGEPGAATRDVEAQESEHTFQRTADEIVKETKRPYADWMRRGELALRLGKPEEAKIAFWACLKLAEKEKAVCVTSLCRLIEQASGEGDVRTTIRCVDTLWSYLDSKTKKKDNSEPSQAVPPAQKSIFRLISKKGLGAVRELVNSGLDVNRKRLDGLLLDSVALRVDGFMR